MGGPCSLQELSPRRRRGPVHALERVAYRLPHLPIVRRMGRIVEMPALVTGTVGLREHLNGEVPILLVEELERQRRLLRNRQLQPRHKPLEIVGGRPVDIAIARQRISPHPRRGSRPPVSAAMSGSRRRNRGRPTRRSGSRSGRARAASKARQERPRVCQRRKRASRTERPRVPGGVSRGRKKS